MSDETTEKTKFKLGIVLTGLVPVPVYYFFMERFIDPSLGGEQAIAQMIKMGFLVLFLLTPAYLVLWRLFILRRFIPTLETGTANLYLVMIFVINYALLFAGCTLGLLD